MILKWRSNDDDNYFSWFYDSMIVGDIFALLQSLTHHKSFPLVCDTYGQSHSQPVINIARKYVPRSSPIFYQWCLSWISIIQLDHPIIDRIKKEKGQYLCQAFTNLWLKCNRAGLLKSIIAYLGFICTIWVKENQVMFAERQTMGKMSPIVCWYQPPHPGLGQTQWHKWSDTSPHPWNYSSQKVPIKFSMNIDWSQNRAIKF